MVLHQIRALDETLGTDLALIRPVTRVRPQMFGQGGPLSVRLLAHQTLIGSMNMWSPLVADGRGATRETCRLDIRLFHHVGVLCFVAGRVPLGSPRLAGTFMPLNGLVTAEALATVTTDMRFVFWGDIIRYDIMMPELRLFHLDQRDDSTHMIITSLVRFSLKGPAYQERHKENQTVIYRLLQKATKLGLAPRLTK